MYVQVTNLISRNLPAEAFDNVDCWEASSKVVPSGPVVITEVTVPLIIVVAFEFVAIATAEVVLSLKLSGLTSVTVCVTIDKLDTESGFKLLVDWTDKVSVFIVLESAETWLWRGDADDVANWLTIWLVEWDGKTVEEGGPMLPIEEVIGALWLFPGELALVT